MMDALFDGLTVFDFHGDSHRNIVSLRESQHLFDDLSDSEEDWATAMDIEMAAKPHTHVSHQPIIDRPFEESAYNEAISYPFAHWANSRYSDGTFGVWYGSDSLVTSIIETSHHWRRGFLEDAGWQNMDGVRIERKVYLVRCDAALLDFRPKVGAEPGLVDLENYHLTLQIGRRFHHDGHPGLISRSARCSGDIHALFRPQVLSNPRVQCYLTYRLEQGGIIVERQLGEEILRI